MGSSYESEHASNRPLQNSGSFDRDSAPEPKKLLEACFSSSREDWAAARADALRLEAVGDLEAARCYVAMWPNHPPDYFQDSANLRKRRARARAWGDGDAWASRMVLAVESIGHFSLHSQHLGLAREDAAARGLFDPAVIARWKEALRRSFTGPLHWHLEVGERGVLHCHVLAAFNDGPEGLQRPSAVVRACDSYLEAAVAYQYKPSLPYLPEMLALYWANKAKRRRLPNTSGTLGFSNPSVLRTNSPNPVLEAPLAPSLFSPVPVQARADSTPAQASRRNGGSALARVASGASIFAQELIAGLEHVPKDPYVRVGGHFSSLERPEGYKMARRFRDVGLPPRPQEGRKSLTLRPSRGKRGERGQKRLAIATPRSRLVSIAPPPSPLTRLLEAVRSAFFSKEKKVQLEPVAPLLSRGPAEKPCKSLREQIGFDTRTTHAGSASEALRYSYRATRPSTGRKNHAYGFTKSRRSTTGDGDYHDGGYRRPPGRNDGRGTRLGSSPGV